MSSRTALVLLTDVGEPMMINEDNTAAALCVTEAHIKKWFLKNGFRTDGARCAMNRWLSDWLACGQIYRAKRNAPIYYFAEIPARKAYSVVTFAEEQRPYAVSVYTRGGQLDTAICEQIGLEVIA